MIKLIHFSCTIVISRERMTLLCILCLMKMGQIILLSLYVDDIILIENGYDLIKEIKI